MAMTDHLRDEGLLVCPVCLEPVRKTQERVEPVKNPQTGRPHGWSRAILTYVHFDGREHRVPGGPIFAEERR
jgi:hypothetical protein